MSSALSLKIRKILDLPLKKKPLWFRFFLPLFFIISFIISFIAKNRRRKSYALSSPGLGLSSPGLTGGSMPGSVKIICVGNILIGGTGKSPIVQKIAQEFLEKGFIVAIASRGITQSKEPVYNNIHLLSDENREHYELLNSKNLSKNLFILQNKNRNESLCYFMEEVKKNPPKLGAVFILDDGLQHFTCPRDINLCVWNPDHLLNSPHFSMPVGPYREGFGQESFKELLNTFNFRLWSRTRNENITLFTQKISQSLNKYNLNPTHQDFIVCYELKVFKILFQNNQYVYNEVNSADICNIISAGIITGIAYPDAFLADLQKYFTPCRNWNSLFLEDHASFQISAAKILQFIDNQQTCIFTLKDFFRWHQEEAFKRALTNKQIYGCSLELHFYDILNNKIYLSEKL